MSDSVDRQFELNHLRQQVTIAVMRLMAERLEGPPLVTVPEGQDAFDLACTALADKLREPETCYACHQQVPREQS